MDVNAYLAKQYEFPPCWQLVADVYAAELNLPVNEYKTVNSSIRAIASAFRVALHKSASGFTQIALPVDYCVVLMGRSAAMGLHHCGVFFEGRVLHGLPEGNRYEELSVIGDTYPLVEYWGRAA